MDRTLYVISTGCRWRKILDKSKWLCADYPLLFWLAFGLLAQVLACSGPVPPRPPSPTVPAKAKTVLSLPPPDPCQIAAELRKLGPALLEKGRLDRTVRFIDKAHWLCPATAAENRVIPTKLITSDCPLPVR